LQKVHLFSASNAILPIQRPRNGGILPFSGFYR